MKNKIVFAQPLRIRFHQRRPRPFQLLVRNLRGMPFEVDVPNPAAAQANQGVPVSRKWQLENHAEHAVIVVLDLSFEAFARFQNQWLDRLNHRRALIANVSRSGMFEAGLLECARPKNLAKLVELDLLTNIELDQNQHRAAQGKG